MTTHTIVVGNIGTVCTTTDDILAASAYRGWVVSSRGSTGRGAGEPVLWSQNGELYREYSPPHPIDSLPDHELSADQLDEKYNPDGDGEHPRFTRTDWQLDIAAGDTLSGYWDWLCHRLITEHEQVAVHNFTVAVTAPGSLTREEVFELLAVFSNAAIQDLQDIVDDSIADKDERDQASAALKLNIEILP